MKIHIVQKGDTMWKIARKYGVDFKELLRANRNLKNPDLIYPGMKIRVPTGQVPAQPGEIDGNQLARPRMEMPMKEAPIKEVPILEAPMEPIPLEEEAPIESPELEIDMEIPLIPPRIEGRPLERMEIPPAPPAAPPARVEPPRPQPQPQPELQPQQLPPQPAPARPAQPRQPMVPIMPPMPLIPVPIVPMQPPMQIPMRPMQPPMQMPIPPMQPQVRPMQPPMQVPVQPMPRLMIPYCPPCHQRRPLMMPTEPVCPPAIHMPQMSPESESPPAYEHSEYSPEQADVSSMQESPSPVQPGSTASPCQESTASFVEASAEESRMSGMYGEAHPPGWPYGKERRHDDRPSLHQPYTMPYTRPYTMPYQPYMQNRQHGFYSSSSPRMHRPDSMYPYPHYMPSMPQRDVWPSWECGFEESSSQSSAD